MPQLMSKDQAAYKSKMRWWRQRKKQEDIARERDERLHGEVVNEDDDDQK